MVNGRIVNCARCNRVFKKALNDKCPECVEAEYQQFQMMFRLLQSSAEHGGMFIDDLAEKVGLSVDYIEQFYLDAKLGTAGLFLKFKCRGCGELIAEINRKGRYCVNCSETISTRAGVEVKSRSQLTRESEEVKLATVCDIATRGQSAPEAVNDSAASNRNGFLRNR
ncbi:MAG: hypothetical protein IPK79_11250 [Vampirovibrionales bacterium]|nr:hypothetical protein [Vampirovibrionales bacterium]